MLKNFRPEQILSAAWVNQVTDFVNGLKFTSDGSILCRRVGNQIHLVNNGNATFTCQVLSTSDDGGGYPDPLSGDNVFFANFCSTPSQAFTTSGYNDLSLDVQEGGTYFFNIGNTYIPEDTLILAVSFAGYYFANYDGGELVLGSASGGPGSVNVTAKSVMGFTSGVGWTASPDAESTAAQFQLGITSPSVFALNGMGWDMNTQPIVSSALQSC